MDKLDKGTPFPRMPRLHWGFQSWILIKGSSPAPVPSVTEDCVLFCFLSHPYLSSLCKNGVTSHLFCSQMVTEAYIGHNLYLYYSSSSGVCWCILFSCAAVWSCRSAKALLPWLLQFSSGTHSPSWFLWGLLCIVQHGWPVFSFENPHAVSFPDFICPILSLKGFFFSLFLCTPPHLIPTVLLI